MANFVVYFLVESKFLWWSVGSWGAQTDKYIPQELCGK